MVDVVLGIIRRMGNLGGVSIARYLHLDKVEHGARFYSLKIIKIFNDA